MPAILHPQTVAAPSPAEIRRRCKAIQASWSAETRKKRLVFKVEPWMLTAVEIHLPRHTHVEDDYGRVA
jgi:hypothetical protein